MLANAFNMLISIHSRPAILRRYNAVGVMPSSVTSPCRIAPSNYFRKTQGPSETTIKGREYVISKATITAPFTPAALQIGDKVEDTEFGNLAIIEIQEMCDLGGSVMGYRVRVE